jgi:hypothetical protein
LHFVIDIGKHQHNHQQKRKLIEDREVVSFSPFKRKEVGCVNHGTGTKSRGQEELQIPVIVEYRQNKSEEETFSNKDKRVHVTESTFGSVVSEEHSLSKMTNA